MMCISHSTFFLFCSQMIKSCWSSIDRYDVWMTLRIPYETSWLAAHEGDNSTSTVSPVCLWKGQFVTCQNAYFVWKNFFLYHFVFFLLTFPMACCHQISRRQDEQHLEAESTLVYDKACEGTSLGCLACVLKASLKTDQWSLCCI